ncbi:MAG: alcohol dehydrogenase catalytic domain-containing protein, partial [Actinobacteria bacterium]|nr:alcohol dehydrogenase catalytic domain-containing protein [Actinomycetota bacterium]NIS33740.1 alcohol dehydrogenase catalytic domain-containing protein [Actinomycetota bacterium]NIT97063.1 alcohol dehydrogenase catalytic domain-containing protein [Actinomycetota bacterium]NIU20733.1 alcohol dehydrogenase catalytic domain-containing protein [Actinomycetota bacterium]NIU68585.1 alcohol dehydrogenase catalytic domain-containing protein [Actinomycetota bacterium]
MRAALLTTPNSPLEIVHDLDIEDPRAGEVMVRVANCGICHSDLTIQESGYTVPIVLGHEAAGVIESVGPGVTHLSPGDHVLLTPLAPCGHCAACGRHEATACPDALS